LFNTEDPVVPFFHQALFQAKVDAAGAADLLTQRTSAVAFGHCVFAPGEAESAFGLLVSEVGSTAVAAVR
jgi:hypothetical protein